MHLLGVEQWPGASGHSRPQTNASPLRRDREQIVMQHVKHRLGRHLAQGRHTRRHAAGIPPTRFGPRPERQRPLPTHKLHGRPACQGGRARVGRHILEIHPELLLLRPHVKPPGRPTVESVQSGQAIKLSQHLHQLRKTCFDSDHVTRGCHPAFEFVETLDSPAEPPIVKAHRLGQGRTVDAVGVGWTFSTTSTTPPLVPGALPRPYAGPTIPGKDDARALQWRRTRQHLANDAAKLQQRSVGCRIRVIEAARNHEQFGRCNRQVSASVPSCRSAS